MQLSLKETLKKERDEGYKLKRKFEDMQNEVKTSKAELQTLQANKMTLEVSMEKIDYFISSITEGFQ